MQLHDIAWAGIRRRLGRVAFTVSVVAVAIGTVITLVALTRAMQAEIGDELDRFGANIIITPKAQSLDLAYGGIAVAGLTVDERQLRAEDAALVRTIPNRKNVNAVAPKLLGSSQVSGVRVLLIGVRQSEEARVKSWWHVTGRLPKDPGEVLLGADAAKALGAGPGATLALGGRDRNVAGVLAATGSLDDGAVVADLEVVQ